MLAVHVSIYSTVPYQSNKPTQTTVASTQPFFFFRKHHTGVGGKAKWNGWPTGYYKWACCSSWVQFSLLTSYVWSGLGTAILETVKWGLAVRGRGYSTWMVFSVSAALFIYAKQWKKLLRMWCCSPNWNRFHWHIVFGKECNVNWV